MRGLARNPAELTIHAPELYTGLVSAMGSALQTLSKPDSPEGILTEATVVTFKKKRFDDGHRQMWYWDSRSATTEAMHSPADVLTAWELRNLHVHNLQRPRKTDVTLD